MNALVRSGGIPVPFTPAPLGFGPGGPLPAPTPWILYGNYINFPGAVTIGNPTGGSKGPGTINATGVYQNGVLFDISNYLPLSGGALTGPLSITGLLTLSNGITMSGHIDGGIVDMGVY